MRLNDRQKNKINDFLTESFRSYEQDRVEADKLLTETRRNNYLFESDEELNASSVGETLNNRLVGFMLDHAQDFLVACDKELGKEIANLIRDMGGNKLSAATVLDDLEDVDPDSYQDLQMEFVTDVLNLMQVYTRKIAQHAAMGGMFRTSSDE